MGRSDADDCGFVADSFNFINDESGRARRTSSPHSPPPKKFSPPKYCKMESNVSWNEQGHVAVTMERNLAENGRLLWQFLHLFRRRRNEDAASRPAAPRGVPALPPASAGKLRPAAGHMTGKVRSSGMFPKSVVEFLPHIRLRKSPQKMFEKKA